MSRHFAATAAAYRHRARGDDNRQDASAERPHSSRHPLVRTSTASAPSNRRGSRADDIANAVAGGRLPSRWTAAAVATRERWRISMDAVVSASTRDLTSGLCHDLALEHTAGAIRRGLCADRPVKRLDADEAVLVVLDVHERLARDVDPHVRRDVLCDLTGRQGSASSALGRPRRWPRRSPGRSRGHASRGRRTRRAA